MIQTLNSPPLIPQAVRLESGWSDRVRYMVVIYTNGHQDTEENIVLGMDFPDKDRYSLFQAIAFCVLSSADLICWNYVLLLCSKSCSIGMVLPLWSDTNIHLDGDGYDVLMISLPFKHTVCLSDVWMITYCLLVSTKWITDRNRSFCRPDNITYVCWRNVPLLGPMNISSKWALSGPLSGPLSHLLTLFLIQPLTGIPYLIPPH